MVTIVIIEEKFSTRFLLSQLLEVITEDFESKIITFDDISLGISWLEVNNSSMIILGKFKSNIQNYIDVIHQIKTFEANSNTPLLVTERRDVSQYLCLKAGAFDCLSEPLDYEELKFKFTNLLLLKSHEEGAAEANSQVLPLMGLSRAA